MSQHLDGVDDLIRIESQVGRGHQRGPSVEVVDQFLLNLINEGYGELDHRIWRNVQLNRRRVDFLLPLPREDARSTETGVWGEGRGEGLNISPSPQPSPPK